MRQPFTIGSIVFSPPYPNWARPSLPETPGSRNKQLQPGDIVHFVVPYSSGEFPCGFDRIGNCGDHVAGVMTYAWQHGGARIKINLPTLPGERYWCEATEQDEEEKRPGTWHFHEDD